MTQCKILTGDIHNQVSKMIYGNHLIRPDIYRPGKIGFHQTSDTIHTLLYEKKFYRLAPISPDFDFTTVGRFSNLAGNSRRRFFSTSLPCAVCAKYVVE